jgi:hypothetical protein
LRQKESCKHLLHGSLCLIFLLFKPNKIEVLLLNKNWQYYYSHFLNIFILPTAGSMRILDYVTVQIVLRMI